MVDGIIYFCWFYMGKMVCEKLFMGKSNDKIEY